MEQGASGSGRQHREGIRPVEAQLVVLQRIAMSIRGARVDLRNERLTDVQHRSFVTLPLTDGDTTIEGDPVECGAHRFHGGTIRSLAILASTPSMCCDGSRFGRRSQIGDQVTHGVHVGTLGAPTT